MQQLLAGNIWFGYRFSRNWHLLPSATFHAAHYILSRGLSAPPASSSGRKCSFCGGCDNQDLGRRNLDAKCAVQAVPALTGGVSGDGITALGCALGLTAPRRETCCLCKVGALARAAPGCGGSDRLTRPLSMAANYLYQADMPRVKAGRVAAAWLRRWDKQPFSRHAHCRKLKRLCVSAHLFGACTLLRWHGPQSQLLVLLRLPGRTGSLLSPSETSSNEHLKDCGLKVRDSLQLHMPG